MAGFRRDGHIYQIHIYFTTDNQLQNLEDIDPQMYQSPTCTFVYVPMPMLQLIGDIRC